MASKQDNAKQKSIIDFAFGKRNYQLLIAGLLIIFVGFIIMAGGKSTDPNVFNEDIFSTRRVTIAPITILAGFIVILLAIMHKSKD